MEEISIKSIRGLNQEEVNQLIDEMARRGWSVKAIGKEAIHFTRPVMEYVQ